MKNCFNNPLWTFTSYLFLFSSFAASVHAQEEEETITLNNFNNKIFWEKDHQGMVPLDLSFSGVNDSMLVIAVGDMDGDKYTDMITINPQRTAFRAFLYNSNTKKFEFGEKEFPAECVISNIQTIKTSNENSGLLVTCSSPDSFMKIYAYDDDVHDFVEVPNFRPHLKAETQPFIADFNGDFYPDILYQGNTEIEIAFLRDRAGAPEHSTSSHSVETHYLNDLVMGSDVSSQCLDVTPGRHLASQGSIGYADLDGDCVADLILTTQDPSSKNVYVEIYIAMLADHSGQASSFSFNTKYCLVKRAPLPDDIDPMLLFADFDREGMIDLLGFSPTKKQVYIFLNGIKPRSSESEGLCYVKNQLYQDGEVFPALDGNLTIKSHDHVMFNKIHKIPYFNKLHGHTDVFPPRLRFSDINADGYPDLIGTFELSGHNAFPAVLINAPCEDKFCEENERIFVYDESKYNDELKKHNDCNYAFFFDIGENGIIDIILSIHDVNHRKDKILPLMSNYDQDSFFLKTKVVRNVDSKNDVVHSGATIRASFTQLGDKKYILVGTQRSQESYTNLGISYAYFGIGRSTNYIEQFTVGAVVYGKKVVKSWTPIIPNTQLIVSCQDSGNAAHWKLDLLVGPTKAIGILVIVLSLFLFVLGLLIIILHFGEKAEDERQKVKAFDFL